jgi:hypothetical protein
MKKHIVLILLFVIANTFVLAQIKFADSKTINEFMKTKTYIVLEDVMFSDFNSEIETAAAKHWKITKYEIIDVTTFEKISKNTGNSFLIVTIGEVTGLPTTFSFNLLNLVMGHSSGDINKMKEIIIVPLSYYSEEGDDEESYAYKLGGILDAFQYYILNQPGDDWKAWVKENKKDLKDKELWLTASDLAPEMLYSSEPIKSIYPYTVKIVTEKEIQQAIEKKLPHVAFVHKIGTQANMNAYCMKLIIACVDGKLLYLNYDKITKNEAVGMLQKDFKALAE